VPTTRPGDDVAPGRRRFGLIITAMTLPAIRVVHLTTQRAGLA
jgi:hypothetical protein